MGPHPCPHFLACFPLLSLSWCLSALCPLLPGLGTSQGRTWFPCPGMAGVTAPSWMTGSHEGVEGPLRVSDQLGVPTTLQSPGQHCWQGLGCRLESSGSPHQDVRPQPPSGHVEMGTAHHTTRSTNCAHPEDVLALWSWEGQRPRPLFLNCTSCIHFSVSATRHWDLGAPGSAGTRTSQASSSSWAVGTPPQACPPVL